MGGRGSFDHSSGTIPIEHREYVEIGTIEGIKIIEGISTKNGKTPVMSNSADTAYAVWSETAGKIKHVFYYKDHVLYKAIDLEGSKSHWHHVTVDKETGKIGRISHDPDNVKQLLASQWELVRTLERWRKP